MNKGHDSAIEEMKRLLNEKFFDDRADAMFFKLKYGVELQFVSSVAELKFFIPEFGEHVCYGAIFIYTHQLYRSAAFMSLAWEMAVNLADGKQLSATPVPNYGTTKRFPTCPAVMHRDTIFIYANNCMFFTNPTSSFGSIA